MALIHRQFILGPVLKALRGIRKLLAAKLIDGAFVSEICELDPVPLCYAGGLSDRRSGLQVEKRAGSARHGTVFPAIGSFLDSLTN